MGRDRLVTDGATVHLTMSSFEFRFQQDPNRFR